MLEGKTALITGASRGIGRSIAYTLAKYGAFIGINYHSDDYDANKTLEMIKNIEGRGLLLKGDISKKQKINKIVNLLLEQRGQIDILINNAGIYQRLPFEKIKTNDWEKTLKINLTGCYYLCKKVIPHIKAYGKIIFISSQLAFRGSSHGAHYATAKAGMLGLMRSLALELAKKNILVNAIAPGTIDTDIIANYSEKMRRKRIIEIPLGRLGTPEDVANVCLFLASDFSNYITGETIHVNGGLYIH